MTSSERVARARDADDDDGGTEGGEEGERRGLAALDILRAARASLRPGPPFCLPEGRVERNREKRKQTVSMTARTTNAAEIVGAGEGSRHTCPT